MKDVMIIRCICGKSIIQAGDPDRFKDLKSKRELGQLALDGHKIETVSYEKYQKEVDNWHCKNKEGNKIKGCKNK